MTTLAVYKIKFFYGALALVSLTCILVKMDYTMAPQVVSPFRNIDIIVVKAAKKPHLFQGYNDRCDPTQQVCSATEEDIDTLARTIWAEARGDGYEGMRAVAEVIVNRALDPKRWPSSISEVAKQNRQFSCWNKRDPNRRKLLNVTESDKDFCLAMESARDAVEGNSPIRRSNITHFHTHRVAPQWAQGQTPDMTIGGHVFYTL